MYHIHPDRLERLGGWEKIVHDELKLGHGLNKLSAANFACQKVDVILGNIYSNILVLTSQF
jgi:hypothetical protein